MDVPRTARPFTGLKKTARKSLPGIFDRKYLDSLPQTVLLPEISEEPHRNSKKKKVVLEGAPNLCRKHNGGSQSVVDNRKGLSSRSEKSETEKFTAEKLKIRSALCETKKVSFTAEITDDVTDKENCQTASVNRPICPASLKEKKQSREDVLKHSSLNSSLVKSVHGHRLMDPVVQLKKLKLGMGLLNGDLCLSLTSNKHKSVVPGAETEKKRDSMMGQQSNEQELHNNMENIEKLQTTASSTCPHHSSQPQEKHKSESGNVAVSRLEKHTKNGPSGGEFSIWSKKDDKERDRMDCNIPDTEHPANETHTRTKHFSDRKDTVKRKKQPSGSDIGGALAKRKKEQEDERKPHNSLDRTQLAKRKIESHDEQKQHGSSEISQAAKRKKEHKEQKSSENSQAAKRTKANEEQEQHNSSESSHSAKGTKANEEQKQHNSSECSQAAKGTKAYEEKKQHNSSESSQAAKRTKSNEEQKQHNSSGSEAAKGTKANEEQKQHNSSESSQAAKGTKAYEENKQHNSSESSQAAKRTKSNEEQKQQHNSSGSEAAKGTKANEEQKQYNSSDSSQAAKGTKAYEEKRQHNSSQSSQAAKRTKSNEEQKQHNSLGSHAAKGTKANEEKKQYNSSESSHAAKRTKSNEEQKQHNLSETSHAAKGTKVNEEKKRHNSSESSQAAKRTKSNEEQKQHNLSETSHAAKGTKVNEEKKRHNSSESSQAAKRTKTNEEQKQYNSSESSHAAKRTKSNEEQKQCNSSESSQAAKGTKANEEKKRHNSSESSQAAKRTKTNEEQKQHYSSASSQAAKGTTVNEGKKQHHSSENSQAAKRTKSNEEQKQLNSPESSQEAKGKKANEKQKQHYSSTGSQLAKGTKSNEEQKQHNSSASSQAAKGTKANEKQKQHNSSESSQAAKGTKAYEEKKQHNSSESSQAAGGTKSNEEQKQLNSPESSQAAKGTKANEKQKQHYSSTGSQLAKGTKSNEEQKQHNSSESSQAAKWTKAYEEKKQHNSSESSQAAKRTKSNEEQKQHNSSASSQAAKGTKANEKQKQHYSSTGSQLAKGTKSNEEQKQLNSSESSQAAKGTKAYEEKKQHNSSECSQGAKRTKSNEEQKQHNSSASSQAAKGTKANEEQKQHNSLESSRAAGGTKAYEEQKQHNSSESSQAAKRNIDRNVEDKQHWPSESSQVAKRKKEKDEEQKSHDALESSQTAKRKTDKMGEWKKNGSSEATQTAKKRKELTSGSENSLYRSADSMETKQVPMETHGKMHNSREEPAKSVEKDQEIGQIQGDNFSVIKKNGHNECHNRSSDCLDSAATDKEQKHTSKTHCSKPDSSHSSHNSKDKKETSDSVKRHSSDSTHTIKQNKATSHLHALAEDKRKKVSTESSTNCVDKESHNDTIKNMSASRESKESTCSANRNIKQRESSELHGVKRMDSAKRQKHISESQSSKHSMDSASSVNPKKKLSECHNQRPGIEINTNAHNRRKHNSEPNNQRQRHRSSEKSHRNHSKSDMTDSQRGGHESSTRTSITEKKKETKPHEERKQISSGNASKTGQQKHSSKSHTLKCNSPDGIGMVPRTKHLSESNGRQSNSADSAKTEKSKSLTSTSENRKLSDGNVSGGNEENTSEVIETVKRKKLTNESHSTDFPGDNNGPKQKNDINTKPDSLDNCHTTKCTSTLSTSNGQNQALHKEISGLGSTEKNVESCIDEDTAMSRKGNAITEFIKTKSKSLVQTNQVHKNDEMTTARSTMLKENKVAELHSREKGSSGEVSSLGNEVSNEFQGSTQDGGDVTTCKTSEIKQSKDGETSLSEGSKSSDTSHKAQHDQDNSVNVQQGCGTSKGEASTKQIVNKIIKRLPECQRKLYTPNPGVIHSKGVLQNGTVTERDHTLLIDGEASKQKKSDTLQTEKKDNSSELHPSHRKERQSKEEQTASVKKTGSRTSIHCDRSALSRSMSLDSDTQRKPREKKRTGSADGCKTSLTLRDKLKKRYSDFCGIHNQINQQTKRVTVHPSAAVEDCVNDISRDSVNDISRDSSEDRLLIVSDEEIDEGCRLERETAEPEGPSEVVKDKQTGTVLLGNNADEPCSEMDLCRKKTLPAMLIEDVVEPENSSDSRVISTPQSRHREQIEIGGSPAEFEPQVATPKETRPLNLFERLLSEGFPDEYAKQQEAMKKLSQSSEATVTYTKKHPEPPVQNDDKIKVARKTAVEKTNEWLRLLGKPRVMKNKITDVQKNSSGETVHTEPAVPEVRNPNCSIVAEDENTTEKRHSENRVLVASREVESTLLGTGGDVENTLLGTGGNVEKTLLGTGGDIENTLLGTGGDVENTLLGTGGDVENTLLGSGIEVENSLPVTCRQMETRLSDASGETENTLHIAEEDVENTLLGTEGDVENRLPGTRGDDENRLPCRSGDVENRLSGAGGDAENRLPGAGGDVENRLPGTRGDDENRLPGRSGDVENRLPDAGGDVENRLPGAGRDVENRLPGAGGYVENRLPGAGEDVENRLPGAGGDVENRLPGAGRDVENRLPDAGGDVENRLPASGGDACEGALISDEEIDLTKCVKSEPNVSGACALEKKSCRDSELNRKDISGTVGNSTCTGNADAVSRDILNVFGVPPRKGHLTQGSVRETHTPENTREAGLHSAHSGGQANVTQHQTASLSARSAERNACMLSKLPNVQVDSKSWHKPTEKADDHSFAALNTRTGTVSASDIGLDLTPNTEVETSGHSCVDPSFQSRLNDPSFQGGGVDPSHQSGRVDPNLQRGCDPDLQSRRIEPRFSGGRNESCLHSDDVEPALRGRYAEPGVLTGSVESHLRSNPEFHNYFSQNINPSLHDRLQSGGITSQRPVQQGDNSGPTDQPVEAGDHHRNYHRSNVFHPGLPGVPYGCNEPPNPSQAGYIKLVRIPISHKKITTVGIVVTTRADVWPELFYFPENKCIRCLTCRRWMGPLDFLVHHDQLPAGVEIHQLLSLSRFEIQPCGELNQEQKVFWDQFCQDLKNAKECWKNNKEPQPPSFAVMKSLHGEASQIRPPAPPAVERADCWYSPQVRPPPSAGLPAPPYPSHQQSLRVPTAASQMGRIPGPQTYSMCPNRETPPFQVQGRAQPPPPYTRKTLVNDGRIGSVGRESLRNSFTPAHMNSPSASVPQHGAAAPMMGSRPTGLNPNSSQQAPSLQNQRFEQNPGLLQQRNPPVGQNCASGLSNRSRQTNPQSTQNNTPPSQSLIASGYAAMGQSHSTTSGQILTASEQNLTSLQRQRSQQNQSSQQNSILGQKEFPSEQNLTSLQRQRSQGNQSFQQNSILGQKEFPSEQSHPARGPSHTGSVRNTIPSRMSPTSSRSSHATSRSSDLLQHMTPLGQGSSQSLRNLEHWVRETSLQNCAPLAPNLSSVENSGVNEQGKSSSLNESLSSNGYSAAVVNLAVLGRSDDNVTRSCSVSSGNESLTVPDQASAVHSEHSAASAVPQNCTALSTQTQTENVPDSCTSVESCGVLRENDTSLLRNSTALQPHRPVIQNQRVSIQKPSSSVESLTSSSECRADSADVNCTSPTQQTPIVRNKASTSSHSHDSVILGSASSKETLASASPGHCGVEQNQEAEKSKRRSRSNSSSEAAEVTSVVETTLGSRNKGSNRTDSASSASSTAVEEPELLVAVEGETTQQPVPGLDSPDGGSSTRTVVEDTLPQSASVLGQGQTTLFTRQEWEDCMQLPDPFNFDKMNTLRLLALSQKSHNEILKRLCVERNTQREEIQALRQELRTEIQEKATLQSTLATLSEEFAKLKSCIADMRQRPLSPPSSEHHHS